MGGRETDLNLLGIASLCKPGLALQSELIHYLRTHNWFCLREAGAANSVPGMSRRLPHIWKSSRVCANSCKLYCNKDELFAHSPPPPVLRLPGDQYGQ